MQLRIKGDVFNEESSNGINKVSKSYLKSGAYPVEDTGNKTELGSSSERQHQIVDKPWTYNGKNGR